MTQLATPPVVKPSKPAQLIDVDHLQVEAAVDKLIESAVNLPASDLFFTTNEQHVAILARHLGLIQTICIVSPDRGRKFISHIKAKAGIDTTNTRRPIDGRWIYNKDDGSSVDLRINLIPTINGDDLAIRLLSRTSELLNLEALGLTRDQLAKLQTILGAPGGLILLTGPTGSGKSATLYSCLRFLNDGKRKLNTIEDPVEYVLDGIRQSQVNASVELGFPELLRSVLRQSPDVIMIGEIRDPETAETAVHAANSGHLVLATVHAASAAGAVQSMRSLGVHSHFLATSLRGIIAQRLVRTLCPDCKTSFDLTEAPETFGDVKQWLEPGEGHALFAPRGCDKCHNTGYAARTGIFEVMPITRDLRELISDSRPPRDIRAKAVAEGLLEFRSAALLKVARGITSTEEIFRVLPAEHLLLED